MLSALADPQTPPVVHVSPAAPSEPPPATTTCATCDGVLPGRFCGGCGERRLDEGDLSVRHFLHEAVEAFTDLDSALLRSFRALLTRPGLLTAEYVAGRRVGYLKPMKLFLTCNLIFFTAFSFWKFGVFSLPLEMIYGWMPPESLPRRLVHEAMAAKHLTFAQYAARYDAASDTLSRALLPLFIPLSAPVLALLNRRRTRYLVEHVVFATHVWAWLLLLTPLVFALYALARMAGDLLAGREVSLLAAHGVHLPGFVEVIMTLATYGTIIAYVGLAMRRVYGYGRRGAVVRAFLFGVAVLPMLQIYRQILFFVTVRWIA